MCWQGHIGHHGTLIYSTITDGVANCFIHIFTNYNILTFCKKPTWHLCALITLKTRLVNFLFSQFVNISCTSLETKYKYFPKISNNNILYNIRRVIKSVLYRFCRSCRPVRRQNSHVWNVYGFRRFGYSRIYISPVLLGTYCYSVSGYTFHK